MPSTPSENTRPRWIETKINLQTLVTGILGAAVALTVSYFTLVQRVSLIEADVANLKTAQHDKQVQTENSLTEIKGSVHDTNEKIDKLTNFLLQNNAGNRPDTKRWSR
jgi:hypothetical protein